MTPSLTEQIQRLAEEKLKENEGSNIALWPVPDNEDSRAYWKEVFTMGCNAYASKLEEIRSEIESRANEYLNIEIPEYGKNSPYYGRYAEAKEILSIIDKHLS